MNPKYTVAYNNRGNAYKSKGDQDHALADYNAAIAVSPQFAVAYYNRGIFYFDKGDYANAIADYNRTIVIAAEICRGLQQPRQYLREDGRHESRADADLSEAIALNPNDTGAYKNRADVYTKRGDFDRAIADYDQIIEINPRLMPAYVGRSVAYFKNRKFASGFVSIVQGAMAVQK